MWLLWCTYLVQYAEANIIWIRETAYPWSLHCVSIIWLVTLDLFFQSVNAVTTAWSSYIRPFYSFTLYPATTNFYVTHLDPIISAHILPLYKIHLEGLVDHTLACSSTFYANYISFIVYDYIEPIYDLIVRQINYVLYFTFKYFEEEDWLSNLWSNILFNFDWFVAIIADSFPVQATCGVSSSWTCATWLAYGIVGLVAILIRKLLLGILAGVVGVVLSPVLLLLFLAAKLTMILLPSKSSSTKKGKSQTSSISSSVTPTIRREAPKTVVRQSRTTSVDTRNKGATVSATVPVTSSRSYSRDRPEGEEVRNTPRTSVANGFNSPTPKAQTPTASRSYSSEIPYGLSSPPYMSSRPTPKGYSVASPAASISLSLSSSSNPAVEQLRRRKSPGVVDLGLTPAEALGLVPVTELGQRILNDSEIREAEEDADGVHEDERGAPSELAKDFSFDDL